MEVVKMTCVGVLSLCLVLSSCASVINDPISADVSSNDDKVKPEAGEGILKVADTDGISSDKIGAVSDNDGTIADKDGTVSNHDGFISGSDSTVVENDEIQPDKDEVQSDKDEVQSDKDEVNSDEEAGNLDEPNPEDEDMVIIKMRELGGLLDAKDIAEITAEEQALEDMEEDIPEETEDLTFEPIPMPTDFDSYDRNGDGLVEIKELIQVTGAFENVEDAFKVCDSNEDGYIDREEFKSAPWDLAGKPPGLGIE